jgi:pyruvate ferredoxin oxidoreductase beta subunit
VNSGLYPLYEVENGELKVRRIAKRVSVEEYLKTQARFRHLFANDAGREGIDLIQSVADQNIEKYNLIVG